MYWIKDPATKQPSVTVTLLVIACVLMIGFIILECFVQVRSTYLLDEFFGACMALYGGKMVTRNRRDGRLDADFPRERTDLPHSGDISPK